MTMCNRKQEDSLIGRIDHARKCDLLLVNEQAFTLVELMVSIVIIAILSTSLVAVINQNKQRSRAEDAVSRTNLEKAASAIEAHYYSEGFYPESSEGGNPLDNDNNIVLDNYLTSTWPEDFVYIYDSDADEYDFAILVKRKDNDNYYKYISSQAKILECSQDTPNIDTSVISCNIVED